MVSNSLIPGKGLATSDLLCKSRLNPLISKVRPIVTHFVVLKLYYHSTWFVLLRFQKHYTYV